MYPADQHLIECSAPTPPVAGSSVGACRPTGSPRANLVLLLGALAAAGAIVVFLFFRVNRPGTVAFGQELIDPRYIVPALGCVVASVVPATLAVVAAKSGRRRTVRFLLVVTIGCGAGFLTLLGLDYNEKWRHNLMPGAQYHPTKRYLVASFGHPVIAPGRSAFPARTAPVVPAVASSGAAITTAADPTAGKQFYMDTCAACHGANAAGLPHQGADLRGSKFVGEQTDAQLAAFIKAGRQPGDAKSVLGLAMPPKGGNPSLNDAKIRDIVAFLRMVRTQGGEPAAPGGSNGSPAQAAVIETSLVAPKMLMTLPPAGPVGLRRMHPPAPSPLDVVSAPTGMQQFFVFYFLLTGMTAGLVVLAMGPTCAATWRAGGPSAQCPRRSFVAQFWWLAAVTAIVTVPLLYWVMP